MKAIILGPRRSRHSAYKNQYILDIGAKDRKSAEKAMGKAVEWKSPGKTPKTIKGKITRVHGSVGRVVARFEKGLPGQSFGNTIAIG